jgi:hypothetical protein
MRYTITSQGIEKSENGEFATWAEVKAEWDYRIATATKPTTPEQKQEQWFAIHNAPSERAIGRYERAVSKAIICRRCGTSSLNGAMFTTMSGSGICDDCAA